jgi:hypothetical protein
VSLSLRAAPGAAASGLSLANIPMGAFSPACGIQAVYCIHHIRKPEKDNCTLPAA